MSSRTSVYHYYSTTAVIALAHYMSTTISTPLHSTPLRRRAESLAGSGSGLVWIWSSLDLAKSRPGQDLDPTGPDPSWAGPSGSQTLIPGPSGGKYPVCAGIYTPPEAGTRFGHPFGGVPSKSGYQMGSIRGRIPVARRTPASWKQVRKVVRFQTGSAPKSTLFGWIQGLVDPLSGVLNPSPKGSALGSRVWQSPDHVVASTSTSTWALAVLCIYYSYTCWPGPEALWPHNG